jgi:hypothetical protein
MIRRIVDCLLVVALLPTVSVAEAQQTAKVAKIGWLGVRPAATATEQRESLGREFRALGYVEGKNIVFEYRYADNKFDQLPALADELRILNSTLKLISFDAPYKMRDAARSGPPCGECWLRFRTRGSPGGSDFPDLDPRQTSIFSSLTLPST